MPTSRINLSTTEYVRINNGRGQLIVESLTGDIHVVLSDNKPTVGNSAFHKLTDRNRLPFSSLDTNVWALGKNETSRAVVTEITAAGFDDYYLEVIRGNVPGASPMSAYGLLETGGVVTDRLIWPNGDWFAPPLAGTQVSVQSDNIADTNLTGTGAWALELICLDDQANEFRETILLNGTNSVLSVATNIRFVQCAFVTAYGTNLGPVGNISITNVAKTETYSYITADTLRCSSSARMVPAGKRLIIKSIIGASTSGTAAASANIKIASSKFEGYDYLGDNILMPLANLGYQDNSFGLTLDAPFVASEGEVIGLLVTTDKAAIVSGSWFGILENAI